MSENGHDGIGMTGVVNNVLQSPFELLGVERTVLIVKINLSVATSKTADVVVAAPESIHRCREKLVNQVTQFWCLSTCHKNHQGKSYQHQLSSICNDFFLVYFYYYFFFLKQH